MEADTIVSDLETSSDEEVQVPKFNKNEKKKVIDDIDSSTDKSSDLSDDDSSCEVPDKVEIIKEKPKTKAKTKKAEKTEKQENKNDENKKSKTSGGKKEEKQVKTYGSIEINDDDFSKITEEYIVYKLVKNFKDLMAKEEYKVTELKKIYNYIWQHCISSVYGGFICDMPELSQILDKIDNMITLNKRLFVNNTKLKSPEDSRGNTKSYEYNSDLDIYLLFETKQTRERSEIINAWNLLFLMVSYLEKIDEELFISTTKSFKVPEIFTFIHHSYCDWFTEVNGGSNFTSKLRIFKKQRKAKDAKSMEKKLVTKKASKKAAKK